MWETLEQYARGEIQEFVQRLLEEEGEVLLGRAKSARRRETTPRGYRNGYGKPRQLSLMNGTIMVQRPRVRDLEERFVSRVLPLFQRRTEAVTALLPELYLHGLALGDFELALRGLFGEAAPLSPSSILRLKAAWQAQYDAWRRRDLAELELVYLWADGLYVKAGLEDSKAALLVRIGALADGRKVVLAVESGVRESTESWASMLRDLKARGARAPKLTIADGHLGIWRSWRKDTVIETRDLDENTVLDLDAEGRIRAITIEHAIERTGIPTFSYEQVANVLSGNDSLS